MNKIEKGEDDNINNNKDNNNNNNNKQDKLSSINNNNNINDSDKIVEKKKKPKLSVILPTYLKTKKSAPEIRPKLYNKQMDEEELIKLANAFADDLFENKKEILGKFGNKTEQFLEEKDEERKISEICGLINQMPLSDKAKVYLVLKINAADDKTKQSSLKKIEKRIKNQKKVLKIIADVLENDSEESSLLQPSSRKLSENSSGVSKQDLKGGEMLGAESSESKGEIDEDKLADIAHGFMSELFADLEEKERRSNLNASNSHKKEDNLNKVANIIKEMSPKDQEKTLSLISDKADTEEKKHEAKRLNKLVTSINNMKKYLKNLIERKMEKEPEQISNEEVGEIVNYFLPYILPDRPIPSSNYFSDPSKISKNSAQFSLSDYDSEQKIKKIATAISNLHPENQAEAINLMKQESKEDEKGLKKMRKIGDCLEKINAEKEAKREREMKRKSRITEVNRPLSSSSLQNIANHIMDILFAKGSPMNCKYPQSDAQISSEENRSSSVAYFEAVRFLNEKNNEQRINDVIKVLKTLNDEEQKEVMGILKGNTGCELDKENLLKIEEKLKKNDANKDDEGSISITEDSEEDGNNEINMDFLGSNNLGNDGFNTNKSNPLSLLEDKEIKDIADCFIVDIFSEAKGTEKEQEKINTVANLIKEMDSSDQIRTLDYINENTSLEPDKEDKLKKLQKQMENVSKYKKEGEKFNEEMKANQLIKNYKSNESKESKGVNSQIQPITPKVETNSPHSSNLKRLSTALVQKLMDDSRNFNFSSSEEDENLPGSDIFEKMSFCNNESDTSSEEKNSVKDGGSCENKDLTSKRIEHVFDVINRLPKESQEFTIELIKMETENDETLRGDVEKVAEMLVERKRLRELKNRLIEAKIIKDQELKNKKNDINKDPRIDSDANLTVNEEYLSTGELNELTNEFINDLFNNYNGNRGNNYCSNDTIDEEESEENKVLKTEADPQSQTNHLLSHTTNEQYLKEKKNDLILNSIADNLSDLNHKDKNEVLFKLESEATDEKKKESLRDLLDLIETKMRIRDIIGRVRERMRIKRNKEVVKYEQNPNKSEDICDRVITKGALLNKDVNLDTKETEELCRKCKEIITAADDFSGENLNKAAKAIKSLDKETQAQILDNLNNEIESSNDNINREKLRTLKKEIDSLNELKSLTRKINSSEIKESAEREIKKENELNIALTKNGTEAEEAVSIQVLPPKKLNGKEREKVLCGIRSDFESLILNKVRKPVRNSIDKYMQEKLEDEKINKLAELIVSLDTDDQTNLLSNIKNYSDTESKRRLYAKLEERIKTKAKERQNELNKHFKYLTAEYGSENYGKEDNLYINEITNSLGKLETEEIYK